ncbi:MULTISPECIES: cation diffusion facilitator family transporter [unclassified Planococcus (in: firmicutes)]|uniref:cation diffusion facilitator family transporter n=1 Tax=unclassified Planococcus (in: firmicutes) TaxID=2662419 RepID=UPI000C323870|nr:MULTISPECIES: cation diffusion facilitator family transporter [unclassified Planococcus (in: firmicutes)]AUD14356.1 cation-efflux pump [Planococcus sp. MB-3u-03]PKG46654.1 cation-efflux pump [Planococcus sp. Urea-trap-24]PKG89493.1 cation-efflux pump [Planococcus sp. Urea-3u-39]PKH42073.1 cation-efflux pump [Planococcus sp. MB-3u-09]
MGSSHDHSHSRNKKTLLIAFLIITSYMVVEAVGGYLTNSLALLADAGHMLSDSISLGVGYLAFSIGEKAADQMKTYGYKRFEILAAVFNGVTLVLISLYIFYEAYHRFSDPPEIATSGMLAIAVIGLLVNILVAWILMRGGDTKENLNLRAAFLHVLSDLLGSVGAITAALLIIFFGWAWADPLASVVVAILVLISGWRVTKEAVHVLMEGTPKNVDLEQVAQTIEALPGVKSIHDLHVWSITSGKNAMSGHVVVKEHISFKDSQQVLRDIEHALFELKIGHVTVQLETEDHPHDDSIRCQGQEENEAAGHHHH